jgi:hypothetical protein
MAQTSTIVNNLPIPGLPVIDASFTEMQAGKTPFDSVFVLSYWYKQRADTKFFYSTLPLMETVNRAKAYCEKMGFRFLLVRPFLSNFVEDEKKHAASY